MEIKRAYKFRFYPTPDQGTVLARTFGSARFAYNYMLKARTDAWFNEQRKVGYHETSAMLTALKKDPQYAWLNEVSCVPVQQALRHLQTAFGNFFSRRAGYPSFHSKHGVQSAEYTSSAFKWEKNSLTLAKMKSPLNIRWSRTIPKAAKVTTVTISKDCAGRYFASLLCDDSVAALPKAAGAVGVDLGLTHFAILSTCEKIASPKTFQMNQKKLARLQKTLARKQKGSKNRAKAKTKVARIHAKIADARKDFLHKLSTRLIRENQTISLETLAVKNMSKSAKGTIEAPGRRVKQKSGLNKSILDAGWSEFVRQLQYKALWYGREIIGIDRWYPSSKRCSDCGYVLQAMKLSTREWVCPSCGVHHDRDVNAARNILAAGLAVSALGEAVSPDLAYA